jgi:hypothetical protein
VPGGPGPSAEEAPGPAGTLARGVHVLAVAEPQLASGPGSRALQVPSWQHQESPAQYSPAAELPGRRGIA